MERMSSCGDSPGVKVGARNANKLSRGVGRRRTEQNGGMEDELGANTFQFGTAGEVGFGFYGNLSSEHPEMERESQEFSRGYHEINAGCVRVR